jgi:hypothetical protein
MDLLNEIFKYQIRASIYVEIFKNIVYKSDKHKAM